MEVNNKKQSPEKLGLITKNPLDEYSNIHFMYPVNDIKIMNIRHNPYHLKTM